MSTNAIAVHQFMMSRFALPDTIRDHRGCGCHQTERHQLINGRQCGITHADVIGMHDNHTIIGLETKFPQSRIDRNHWATRISFHRLGYDARNFRLRKGFLMPAESLDWAPLFGSSSGISRRVNSMVRSR